MVSSADVVQRKLADVSRTRSVTGVFVEMVGSLARVNVQGSTVDVRCDGWNPPIPGMPVRVDVTNGSMRVTGPSQTLPARAEVLEDIESGTRARITDGVSDWTLSVMAPYVPIPGDVVVVNWFSGHVLGEEAAAPEVVVPPEQPQRPTSFENLLIQPGGSGKFDLSWSNWWGSDVWASNNNVGAWFYLGRFSALAGADITRVEIFLPPPHRAVGAAFIGLHGHAGIPGGNPGITNLIPLPTRSGWVQLPTGWGAHLRDNPGHGVGVTSGAGDNRWPGVGQAGGGQSGWLRFAGTR